jgi:hypothetical protein
MTITRYYKGKQFDPFDPFFSNTIVKDGKRVYYISDLYFYHLFNIVLS